MSFITIAIDPGKSGAIAWEVNNDKGKSYGYITMPETRERCFRELQMLVCKAHMGEVWVEKVTAFNEGNAHAMLQYGIIVERPVAMLCALGMKIIEIQPKAWQKGLELGKANRPPTVKMPRGLSSKEKKQWKADHADELQANKKARYEAGRDWKNKLKERAAAMYPEFDVTLTNADALLLLRHATTQRAQYLAL